MAARIDELCDAVAATLNAVKAEVVIAGTTVTVTTEDMTDEDAELLAAGDMRVSVVPVGYADGGAAARGWDATEYQIQVTAVERYTAAGPMTVAWRRLRTEWVHRAVYAQLTNPRRTIDGGAYADRIEVTFLASDEQVGKNLFWAAVLVTLREELEV